MPNGLRRPYMLLCGADNIEAEPNLPLWSQVCIAILRLQMFPGLRVDAFASVALGRDIGEIKEKISAGLDPEFADVDLNGVISTDAQAAQNMIPANIGDKYTYACFCGVEPTTFMPEDTRAIYIATKSSPLHLSFHFERLGPSGIVVLQEAEARALLKEFDPDIKTDALTGRELVRALVVQPKLESIRGVVVTYGEGALDGCVASIKITEDVDDFDEDEEEEEDWEREERYEFDIPKAIIGPAEKITPEGVYASFIGKLITSIYIEGVNLGQASYNANQFSFQLEQSCVAAASTALIPGASPWDLPSRIPRMMRLQDNLTRYMCSIRMLHEGDDAPPVRKGTRPPPRPETYWRMPAPPVPTSDSSGFDSGDEDELPALLPSVDGVAKTQSTGKSTKEPRAATSTTSDSGIVAGFKRGFLKGMF